jgi:hypothetical protein
MNGVSGSRLSFAPLQRDAVVAAAAAFATKPLGIDPGETSVMKAVWRGHAARRDELAKVQTLPGANIKTPLQLGADTACAGNA